MTLGNFEKSISATNGLNSRWLRCRSKIVLDVARLRLRRFYSSALPAKTQAVLATKAIFQSPLNFLSSFLNSSLHFEIRYSLFNIRYSPPSRHTLGPRMSVDSSSARINSKKTAWATTIPAPYIDRTCGSIEAAMTVPAVHNQIVRITLRSDIPRRRRRWER